MPAGTSALAPPCDPKPPALLRAAVFAVLVLLWGSTWLVIRIGLESYPPLFSVAVRFCVAGPIFLGFMKLRGIPIPWAWRHQPFFIVIGLLSFTTSYCVVYWAEQYITSGLAAVLFALFPILTGLISLALLRAERLTAGRVLGLVLGLAGIIVIHASDLEQFHPRAPLAALLILISPLVTALSTVLSKRRSRDFHPFAMAGLPMLYGGIVDVGLWLALERGHPLAWSWPGVGAIAYLTLFGSVLTFGGYYWLLPHEEVSRLSLIAYLTPLLALGLGVALGGERVTPQILAGAALVISGVAVAGWKRRRPVGPPGPSTSPSALERVS